MKRAAFFILLFFWLADATAQSANEIVSLLKSKLDAVKDYEAVGKLKTDVAFL